jgi:hypothetical protein
VTTDRDTIVRWLRAHALEATLLAATSLALLGTVGYLLWAGVRSSGASSDLTFAGATRELASTLRNAPDRVVRLARARFVIGGDTVLLDTLVLAADSVEEPAVAKGGFIADQIALYNEFSVQHALQRARPDAASETAVPIEGTSLLRVVSTAGGSRRVSDQPNLWTMTVRSPYAEREWREVRTSDWRRHAGLLGLSGEVALAPDAPARTVAVLNGNDCIVRYEPDPVRALMYCQSGGASDEKRFFDLGFGLRPGAGGSLAFADAFAYRARTIHRNGRSERLGTQSVRAGDVFDVRGMGPFVLSVSDRGTLAAGQWINGRTSFANQQLGTSSFFAAAGRSVPGDEGASPLVLGLDASLSMELDREALRFLRAQREVLQRMSVVVMDLATGEVRAIAEPHRAGTGAPLLSFEPLLMGSVVKPLMASAILARQPELGDLRVEYSPGMVNEVGGVPLTVSFENPANGCGGTIDFEAFLRCSSNQYAAELMVRSLQRDGFRATSAGALVPRDVLERSAIGNGLAKVFDADAFGHRTEGRNPHYWSPRCMPRAGESAATTNLALVPWENRPWLLFPESPGTRIDLLARYGFGGWENRWTLVGVAQAFARIATGREVHASFMHCTPAAAGTNRFAEAPAEVKAAFTRVRGGLSQVGSGGTAAGLTERLRAALGPNLTVLAKTGTLNEDTDRFRAFAMALGVQGQPGPAAALSCGLAVAAWFELSDDATPKVRRAALPSLHLAFANGPLVDAIGRYWRQVPGCSARPAPPAPRGATRRAGQ